jgi:hypothetical protein
MRLGKKIRLTILVFLLAVQVGFAGGLGKQKPKPTDKVVWHSYLQLWTNTNFDGSYTMALRRLKFWLGSGPAFSDHWSFKVQALFTSLGHEKFFLQDVFGQYRNHSGVSSIRFGQFIPKYSLQRFQPDYMIPSVERANVINATIPDGTLGVRDMGFQYNLKAAQKRLELNFGIFNGYGIKDYRLKYKGYLLTHNLSYTIKKPKALWKLGYSVMYRKAVDLPLKHVLPDSVLFTGNDFRFDLYAMFNSKYFDLQAEYLNTWLNGQHVYGYYGLATIKINPKNEFYVSYDKYKDLINSRDDHPWYIAGYNYLFKKHDLMLTLDTRFRKDKGNLKNITTLQFQIFFH